MEEKGVRLLYEDISTRPEELLTRMTFSRDGINEDWSFELVRSSSICSRRFMLLRGSLRGRFDSALIMRWLASR